MGPFLDQAVHQFNVMLVGEGQLEEEGAYPVEDAQYMPCCCLQVQATKFVVCIILVHSSSHS